MTAIIRPGAIFDHAMIQRCLADIAAWNGWEPELSACPRYVVELQGRGDGDIRKLRWILKRLLRDHGFRCTSAQEVCATSPDVPRPATPRRAPAAVRIGHEGQASLVVVGEHGWLHGDKRSAMVDALWLSANTGLPIRRDKREGAP